MSYQERKSILNIITAILIPGVYFWYVFQSHHVDGMSTDALLKFWATTFLILIPVTIGAKIIIMIIFSIGNTIASRRSEDKLDERDKLIELKSSRVSSGMFIFGFMLAMLALALDMSVSTMFIVIICSGILSEIFGNVSQLYFYRKGI